MQFEPPNKDHIGDNCLQGCQDCADEGKAKTPGRKVVVAESAKYDRFVNASSLRKYSNSRCESNAKHDRYQGYHGPPRRALLEHHCS